MPNDSLTMKLAAGAVVALTTVGSIFPAAAQQAFNARQCSDAIGIANALVQANRGRISNGLIDSFIRFSESRCDLNTDFVRNGPDDERVFGEFRVRLVALRTASIESLKR